MSNEVRLNQVLGLRYLDRKSLLDTLTNLFGVGNFEIEVWQYLYRIVSGHRNDYG